MINPGLSTMKMRHAKLVFASPTKLHKFRILLPVFRIHMTNPTNIFCSQTRNWFPSALHFNHTILFLATSSEKSAFGVKFSSPLLSVSVSCCCFSVSGSICNWTVFFKTGLFSFKNWPVLVVLFPLPDLVKWFWKALETSCFLEVNGNELKRACLTFWNNFVKIKKDKLWIRKGIEIHGYVRIL